jgi:exopolyphosphatase / guanosine-5'-triphosphate,3'-diphosphate pyrophosphatase
MSIYDETDSVLSPILNAKEIVGLINYSEKGKLSPDGIMRITETIRVFCKTAQAVDVTSLKCFATAGLRNIRNTDDVISAVEKETGVHIHVISGEEEARLDFVGAWRSKKVNEGLIIDMGGGSTEIVRYKGDKINNHLSLPFGSLFLYKRFVTKILPKSRELIKIRSFVKKQFAVLEWLPNSAQNICLIGGTARAIARLHKELNGRESDDLQGYTFDADDLDLMLLQLDLKKKSAIHDILRVTPERIHTIIPGLVAFTELVHITGCKEISISKDGVREGFLKEYSKDGQNDCEQI